ncbi:hypothetical protein LTR86_004364 [Recurvomyces mirabilis]|nr:hypothetical protein LTR86_004364 [Recurvomyces mirabilis]
MMKSRKFSFDIPRLKIGPSKADNKALKDHLAVQLDSPPPTPKSVRPPLTPHVEAELRSACAYVLQNFKPSHIVFDEKHGAPQKQQLDYAAVKGQTQRDVDVSAPILSKISSRKQDAVALIMKGNDKEPENVSSDKFKYKPATATAELFKEQDKEELERKKASRKSAMLRAEQLMRSDASSAAAIPVLERTDLHQRSASSPTPAAALIPPKPAMPERPWTIPRADSVETSGSTPQTDTTDYPWSEKNSTAMTSAALTPARSSKRTSTQALQTGSESGSAPKADPAGADWMRIELEKHKKAHEERARESNGQNDSSAWETTPTQLSTQTATTPVAIKMPSRKPVPHSRAGSSHEHIQLPVRVQKKISGDQLSASKRHTPEQRKSYTPSRQDSETMNAPSRQAPPVPPHASIERAPSRARSISRKVREYVRSTSRQRSEKPEGLSRAPSRSGRAVRQVKEYMRPGSTTGSRKPSVDLGSRSHSIDSFRTSHSHAAASDEIDGDKKTRNWRPLHRKQESRDTSRPGTSGSQSEDRGRAPRRDVQEASVSSMPTVNLNRDLPPLPGLDQWKDEDVIQDETKEESHLETPMSPRSQKSQPPRHEAAPVSKQPDIGERDEILAARMGSPSRVAPPPPTAPPPAPPMMSANFSTVNDFSYDTWSSSPSATHSNKSSKHERQRSKTIQVYQPTGSPQAAPAKRPIAGERTASAPKVEQASLGRSFLPGGLSRKASRVRQVARTADHTPAAHSRNASNGSSLPNKLSMDDAAHMNDTRYQNLAEIALSNSNTPSQDAAAKEKASKGKWWQRSKDKKSGNWMDQVVKSGSHGGVLLTDDAAGAQPIVKY